LESLETSNLLPLYETIGYSFYFSSTLLSNLIGLYYSYNLEEADTLFRFTPVRSSLEVLDAYLFLFLKASLYFTLSLCSLMSFLTILRTSYFAFYISFSSFRINFC